MFVIRFGNDVVNYFRKLWCCFCVGKYVDNKYGAYVGNIGDEAWAFVIAHVKNGLVS